MNISNWSGKKKTLAILGAILAIVGLIITIFLVQKVQEIRSRAEKATTLTLTPPTQNVNPGEDAKLDVTINPGVNQVNFVKFTIKFDPTKFDPSLTVFNVDSNSPLKPLGDSSFTSYTKDGEVTFTIGVGSDPTKVVKQTTKLGTVLLPAKDSAEAGEADVIFDESKTQVRSLGGNDAFNENVLSSTTPAKVTISGGICRPNVGTCSWDGATGATSYHFKITNTTDNDAVVLEGDVESSVTGIDFPSVPGKTYKCEVTAVNECGESEPSNTTSKCPLPSVTPTPGPSGTPTPTPKPSATPTPKPSATPTLTPTPKPSATPTPSPTPTPTRTPTNSPTPTPTFVVSSTPTPTPTTPQGGIETPIPTLPPTGSPLVVGGIIGGILFILGGLALLFL